MRAFYHKCQPHLIKFNRGDQTLVDQLGSTWLIKATNSVSSTRCYHPCYCHCGFKKHLCVCFKYWWIHLSTGILVSLVLCTLVSSLLHPRTSGTLQLNIPPNVSFGLGTPVLVGKRCKMYKCLKRKILSNTKPLNTHKNWTFFIRPYMPIVLFSNSCHSYLNDEMSKVKYCGNNRVCKFSGKHGLRTVYNKNYLGPVSPKHWFDYQLQHSWVHNAYCGLLVNMLFLHGFCFTYNHTKIYMYIKTSDSLFRCKYQANSVQMYTNQIQLL